MNSRLPTFRRNLACASIAHVALVGLVAMWQGVVAPWRDRSAVEVEIFTPADLLGDMPVGDGTGRGAYTPPRLGTPAAATVSPPGEAIFTPEERPAPAARPTPVKAQAGEVAVPKKEAKPVPAAKPAPATAEKKPSATTATRTSASTGTTRSATASAAVKGSPTGSPTGVSEADIRNRFAKALKAEAGGTPYGDGRKAGGGEGRSPVIGSRNGSPDGIAGGVGKGSPFWWYYQHVHDRMYEAWVQPPESVNWDKRQFSTVVLKVARNGEILAVRLQTPSGNRAMDESALAAARSVEKLQPLPDGLGGATAEITVNFQLEG